MIPRRFTLLLGLLLALPGNRSPLAAQRVGDYAPEKATNAIGGLEQAGGRLQLAAALGKDVPLEMEEAWQKNPHDLQLGLTLLRHYLKQQANIQALALARQLYAAHPGNLEVLKALITTLLANGDTDTALDHASRLTGIQANSPDAWYLLGLVYMQKSDNAPAHRALERAVYQAAA